MNDPTKLSLVVPVFNEEEAIGFFQAQVNETFIHHPEIQLEIIFINDGSTDSTLEKLIALQKSDSRIVIVDLSRNFGKEAALTAGIQIASGEIVVPIDVDLQDPPEVIFAMIAKWRDGYEVVLGYRQNRDSDSTMKRITANWFYRINNKISDTPLTPNVGDFRLMDRKVVEALNQLPESSRFMKGLFAWVGFKTTHVNYTRPQRIAGKTKFNGWKLWNFAIEGITSFSTSPLRIWTYLGIIVSLISFFWAFRIIIRVVILGIDVPGYASIMVAVIFLGGLQLIGIGVLGEYLGRTYLESKRRPIYLIRQIYQGPVK